MNWIQSSWIQNRTSTSYAIWFLFSQLNMIRCLRLTDRSLTSVPKTIEVVKYRSHEDCVNLDLAIELIFRMCKLFHLPYAVDLI